MHAEWENLLRVFNSKKSREFLNQLADVACSLRDTNTHRWQRRQNAIKSIPAVLNDAVEFIYGDGDLVNDVLRCYPAILGQAAQRSPPAIETRASNSATSQ